MTAFCKEPKNRGCRLHRLQQRHASSNPWQRRTDPDVKEFRKMMEDVWFQIGSFWIILWIVDSCWFSWTWLKSADVHFIGYHWNLRVALHCATLDSVAVWCTSNGGRFASFRSDPCRIHVTQSVRQDSELWAQEKTGRQRCSAAGCVKSVTWYMCM